MGRRKGSGDPGADISPSYWILGHGRSVLQTSSDHRKSGVQQRCAECFLQPVLQDADPSLHHEVSLPAHQPLQRLQCKEDSQSCPRKLLSLLEWTVYDTSMKETFLVSHYITFLINSVKKKNT